MSAFGQLGKMGTDSAQGMMRQGKIKFKKIYFQTHLNMDIMKK